MHRPSLLRRYLIGLSATFCGAAISDATGSLLPLALGAAWTVVVTADVVREHRARSRRQWGNDRYNDR